jgi:hypothetical protein
VRRRQCASLHETPRPPPRRRSCSTRRDQLPAELSISGHHFISNLRRITERFGTMASEPPWAILPPSHVSATLTANGEVIRIDDPGKKFYRLGRNEELVDIHIKSQE